MTGTAIVGLAGIVVNNNIVLIDTYNRLKIDFPDKNIEELITETCMSRLRPVLLTTITTIFGLIFLASGYSIDLLNQTVYEGTSTVKWYQAFGISICWGLGFSTVITLIATPALLMILEKFDRLTNGHLQHIMNGFSFPRNFKTLPSVSLPITYVAFNPDIR